MRRRWIYPSDGGEPVEVSSDYVADVPRHDGVLWNDRDYQDMGDPRFSSRSQHREYMRQHGLTTADDFKAQWAKDAANRERAMAGHDPQRKHDINEAIHRLQSGHRVRVSRSDKTGEGWV